MPTRGTTLPVAIFRQPRAVCWLAIAVALSVSGTRRIVAAESPIAVHERLLSDYRAKLEELARWCDEQKLTDEAARTRQWLPRPEPVTLQIPILSARADWDAPAGASPQTVEWCSRFRKLREQQAAALFDLARQALAARQPTLTFELLTAAVRENPDHAEARRVLGYQPVDGVWRTAYEAGKAKAGQAWHEKFGWIARDRVARYERGERYELGHWSKAEDDARRHADMAHGWDIVTEHYQVHTNHSLEEGVRLAKRLERLYRAWQYLFVSYYVSDTQWRTAFGGGSIEPRKPPRHQVVYYRDQAEYKAEMQKLDPRAGVTIGYYQPRLRKAFFFVPSEPDDSTVYHEATHQLFAEMRPVTPLPGRDANAWVLEGVACFMESLAERDGFCVLGGRDAERLAVARHRLLVDNFYVPLSELIALGMEPLQSDERVRRLYTEASGLTYFLVFDGDGRYRDALVEYLTAIYTGRDQPGTLARLTGADLPRLDARYREFLQSTAPATQPGAK